MRASTWLSLDCLVAGVIVAFLENTTRHPHAHFPLEPLTASNHLAGLSTLLQWSPEGP